MLINFHLIPLVDLLGRVISAGRTLHGAVNCVIAARSEGGLSTLNDYPFRFSIIAAAILNSCMHLCVYCVCVLFLIFSPY